MGAILTFACMSVRVSCARAQGPQKVHRTRSCLKVPGMPKRVRISVREVAMCLMTKPERMSKHSMPATPTHTPLQPRPPSWEESASEVLVVLLVLPRAIVLPPLAPDWELVARLSVGHKKETPGDGFWVVE